MWRRRPTKHTTPRYAQNNLIHPTPSDGRFVGGMAAVACGAWHSLALSRSGDAYGWGWNRWGQLGAAVLAAEGDGGGGCGGSGASAATLVPVPRLLRVGRDEEGEEDDVEFVQVRRPPRPPDGRGHPARDRSL